MKIAGVVSKVLRGGGEGLTKLNDDLSKIIGMSRPDKESHVADFALILRLAPEYIFLYIRDTLHKEPNCV